MNVRGKARINDKGNEEEEDFLGILDDTVRLIPGLGYHPLFTEVGVGDGGRPLDVMPACICMIYQRLGTPFPFSVHLYTIIVSRISLVNTNIYNSIYHSITNFRMVNGILTFSNKKNIISVDCGDFGAA